MNEETKKGMVASLRGDNAEATGAFWTWLSTHYESLTKKDLWQIALTLEDERLAGAYDPNDIACDNDAFADALERAFDPKPSDGGESVPDGYVVQVLNGQIHFIYSIEEVDEKQVVLGIIGWYEDDNEALASHMREVGMLVEVQSAYDNYIEDFTPSSAVEGLPTISFGDLIVGDVADGTYFMPLY